MMHGANNLTSRATDARGIASPAATRAPDLAAFAAAFAPLGYDPRALLDAVDLGPLDLADPDARVSCEAYGAVVERALRERFTPNLALRLAAHVPIGAFPLLDYLVLTSDDVGAGIRQLARYYRLINNPVALEIDEHVSPVGVTMRGGNAFAAEFSASLILMHMQRETGGSFRGVHVHFAHRPDDAGEFERLLQCAVTVGDTWTGLAIPLDTWRVPLTRRDPTLRGVLEQQADAIVTRFPADASIAARVRAVLATEVSGEADTRIGAVARRLAVSRRTLQRRLAAEGVAFEDLLDEWRKESARRHLANPAVGVCDVAYLVGYSEPAAFHRAFKRWFGTTPATYRRSRGVGPRASA